MIRAKYTSAARLRPAARITPQANEELESRRRAALDYLKARDLIRPNIERLTPRR